MQHLATLLDKDEDAVIDVKKLLEVANELAESNPKDYAPLVAALQRKTDMQGTEAMGYLLICPPFLKARPPPRRT